MLDTPHNVYDVWITFISVFFPIFGSAFGIWLTWKLSQVHTLVNGNLHTALAKVAELRTRLSANGLDAE